MSGSASSASPDPRVRASSTWLNRSTLGIALAITLKNGRVEQHNFNDYRPMRINECPVIETHLVKSAEAPGGLGEAPTAAVAPAVTNAIFAATGKRIRTLPIDRDLLKSSG